MPTVAISRARDDELAASLRGFGPAGILSAILTGSAPAPSRVVPGLPGALDALIARMLEKSPRQRPRAADVEDALTGLTGSISAPVTVAAVSTGAPAPE